MVRTITDDNEGSSGTVALTLMDRFAVGYEVDVDNIRVLIDCVEDPPVAYSVLRKRGELCRQRFMPQIAGIGSKPLGLVEKPLSRRRIDLRQVADDFGKVCDAIPRHDAT